jgi:Ca-activated chloride channel homolog
MNWSREFSQTEIFFLVSFVLIYLIYFGRIFYISRKLKTSAASSSLKFIIRSIYLGLMSLALLGPNFGVTEFEARSASKDIYLAFDLSLSMNANDVEPSRLDRAKSETLNLIDEFKTDKIGLIVFNSAAQIYTPLTYDHQSLKNNINFLKTNLLPLGTTNFNSFFQLVVEKFGISTKKENRAKVVILITDGENFENIDNQYFTQTKNNEINLFIIGVGSQMGSKIPTPNGYKKDHNGQEVLSVLDINQISEIAKKTNGQYFVLNNQRNQINELTEKLGQVKSSSENINQQTVTYNKYMYFLLIALVFVIFDFLLTVNVLKL